MSYHHFLYFLILSVEHHVKACIYLGFLMQIYFETTYFTFINKLKSNLHVQILSQTFLIFPFGIPLMFSESIIL